MLLFKGLVGFVEYIRNFDLQYITSKIQPKINSRGQHFYIQKPTFLEISIKIFTENYRGGFYAQNTGQVICESKKHSPVVSQRRVTMFFTR